MVFKGFKFGMLLQLAIGPMAILVFNTSATHGFMKGLSLVLAISLVDALFILLSGLGITQILSRKNVRVNIKRLGCMILVLFGANMTAGAFGYAFFPEIALFSEVSNQGFFIQGLLLTASNPLTIIFWGGVFSAQITEHHYSKSQLVLFGIGSVLSSLFFLSFIALSATALRTFLAPGLIQALNAAVGVILIYFGWRLLKKQESAGEEKKV